MMCFVEPDIDTATKEYAYKKQVLKQLGYPNTKAAYSIKQGEWVTIKPSDFKYDMLLLEIQAINYWFEKYLGKYNDEQILKANWREVQYRKCVTDLLDIPEISSWDIIYRKVKKVVQCNKYLQKQVQNSKA